jgi:hypothetical protein
MRVLSLFILELVIFSDLTSFGITPLSQNQPTDDSLKFIEKVFLHVDRDSYFPGDDIWFKAYFVNAGERYLSNHSSNLHVELISPDLEIIDSRTVRLERGLGNGDFHLSEKLPSGKYRIRAYTNYMRNFGNELFFNKDINIINSTADAEAFSDTVNYTVNKPEINFFPEGGSLVDSVASIIAFKAVDEYGYSMNVSGEIYSSTGKMVTTLKSTHKGMGKFLIDPMPGLKYYALIKIPNGDQLKYEIPESFSTGVVLNVSRNQKHELSLIFRTNKRTLPLLIDHDLSLCVSARGKAFKSYTFRMNSLNSFFNLPTDDLPEGIAMITLSGVNDIPLCERLVFIQNDDEARVNIETDKNEYKQRDSVNVKISLRVDSRVRQDAFLSLSATDKLFTDNSTAFPSTITSWFLLESDVRGPVEDPSYYFDFSNPGRLKDLDLLLLTQGWRDFRWKYRNAIYPPEYGLTVSGRIRKKFANTPVKNSVVNIGIFSGSNPSVFVVPVDSSGKFSLGGIHQAGRAKIVATVTNDKDNLKGWLIMDSLRYVPASVESIGIQSGILSRNQEQKTKSLSDSLSGKNNIKSFIEYAEARLSVQRKYKLSDTIKPGEVIITAKHQDALESPRERSRRYLMGTPDIEVEITPVLESYPNTYMLIKNRYFSPFHVQGIPGMASGQGLDPHMHNALFLIDGAVSTSEDVKALPLKWVKRIDIMNNPISASAWLNRMRMTESDTINGPADGVISIILRDDSEIERSKPSHSVNMNFSGYDEPRIFYSPKHHAPLEKDYKPDLRTTLFWKPDLKVKNNKDISLIYYNGDNSSTVKITVEGITTNGIPLTAITEYKVK